MKTFKDLKFGTHVLAKDAMSLPPSHRVMYGEVKQAVMNFENGYGVSVLLGRCFYSNGIDTYELAVLKDDVICYDTNITDDVLRRLTEDDVTEVMIKVQQL